MVPRWNKYSRASQPGLSPVLASLRASQPASTWLEAWVSSAKHTSPLRHASFSLPNPHGSSQPCIARGRSGCGGGIRGRRSRAPGPTAPLASSLTPSPLSQPRSLLFRAAWCKQTIPTLPSGRQPRPVLPTHTTLAPSGFRSGLARGLPTSQGIACPGMQLIWLSPPCEGWGRLLRRASGSPGLPPCRSPPRETAPAGRWESVQKRHGAPRWCRGGAWPSPPRCSQRDEPQRWSSLGLQAPGSQVLTEHFQPALEPGAAQCSAKPVPFVPGCSCPPSGLVCAPEKGIFYGTASQRARPGGRAL